MMGRVGPGGKVGEGKEEDKEMGRGTPDMLVCMQEKVLE